ncbi:MAG: hypothetical protein ACO3RU_00880 [Planctomycetota bacterium]
MTRKLLGLPLVALAACTGDGSDIGPRIEPLPGASYRLTVQDDVGRGVSSARVTLAASASAVTVGDGTCDLLVTAAENAVLRIAADAASASDGDRLVGLTLRTDPFRAEWLSYVVHLPDIAPSAGLAVVPGVVASAQVLDDSVTSGAVIEIPPGVEVSGALAPFVMRTGKLRDDHIPPLPLVGGLVPMASRGIFVDIPSGVSLTPGADLLLPNDLALPDGARAQLFYLDTVTGLWTDIGQAIAGPTGLRADGRLLAGGLYAAAFSPDPAARASLAGFVERELRPTALADLRVRIGQAVTSTDGSGRFALSGIPVVDGAGQPRAARVQLAGGGRHVPVTDEVEVPLAVGEDKQDFERTSPTLNYGIDTRFQLIQRGAALPGTWFGLGTTETGSGDIAVSDDDARFDVPRVEEGFLSFLVGRPDPVRQDRVRVAEGLLSLGRRRNRDLQLFYDEQPWRPGGAPQVWAVDPLRRGLVAGTKVFRNSGGGDSEVGTIRDDRLERYDIRSAEVVLASETEEDGRTVVSAFLCQEFDVGRLEAPIRRASRPRLGAYDPFGIVEGVLAGSGPGLRVVATPRLETGIWFDAARAGEEIEARAPVLLEPSRDGGQRFELGLPAAGGQLVATTTETVGGGLQLTGLGYELGLRPAAGSRAPITGLDLTTSRQAYTVQGATDGRDPRIQQVGFLADVAVEANGGVDLVDAARGLATSPDGSDGLRIDLPALDRLPQAEAHLVLFRGTGRDGDLEVGQQVYARIAAQQVESRGLLAVPQVASPAPGATVEDSGFTVELALPADALFGVVTLRSRGAAVERTWTCVVPQTSTSVRIRPLPAGDDVPDVLVPGDYDLEVEAYRIDFTRCPFRDDTLPYQVVLARFVTLSPVVMGVDAISTARLAIQVLAAD